MSRQKKTPSVAAVGSLKKKQSSLDFTESSATAAQERRIIAALTIRPRTTDACRAIGIFQISARVWGLRAKGYVIETARVTVVDRDGYSHHRAALYSLVSIPEAGAA